MLTVSGKEGRPNTSSTACSSVKSVGASPPSTVRARPLTSTSVSACSMAPAPPPIVASSSTPAPNSSASGLYPRSLRFCNIAAAASCAPSARPVAPALRTRLPIPVIACGPNLSSTLVIPGILSPLAILPRGAISVRPIAVPRNVAAFLSSSVAPAARARSLASPAPAPPAITPATGRAAGPRNAAGSKAPIEPRPEDNL